MESFPVEHSILSSKALFETVRQNYDIEGLRLCRFWQSGSNTTYMVETDTCKYILRAYNHGRWTLGEIYYELDLLLFLKEKGLPVSAPVYMKNGELIIPVCAPEGERFIVMFEFADGSRIKTNEIISSKLGEAAASLHNLSKGFSTKHMRPSLDMHSLIDIPSSALLEVLKYNHSYTESIIAASEYAKEIFDRIGSDLEQGVCHGDMFSGNCHIDEKNQITLFDFDECGPGYIVYDLAVYYWTMKRENQPDVMWKRFLEAYKHKRRLSEADEKAIPIFAAGRQLWFMAQVLVFRADILGYGFSSGSFIEQQVERLDHFVKEIHKI